MSTYYNDLEKLSDKVSAGVIENRVNSTYEQLSRCKFNIDWMRNNARSISTLHQFSDSRPTFFTVIEGVIVHVHADESVCQFRFHITRIIHGVSQARPLGAPVSTEYSA